MLNVSNQTDDVVDEDSLQRLCALVLEREGAAAESAVNLVLCGEDTMRGYNRRYRGVNRSTDVLSFPAELPDGDELGDILIDTHTAAQQKGNHSLDEEVQALLLHGILHLLGHDHQGHSQRMAMEETQQSYMKLFRQEGK